MLPILNQSFWRDEAFSALLAAKPIAEIIQLTRGDASPPFYYILLHFWIQIFGSNEVALRSLSFAFHIGTVLIIFLIAKRLIPSLWAQAALAIAVLLNPFLLQYAFEVRMYSFVAFLSTLIMYFLLRKNYFLTSIALTLMLLSHNFAFFTLFAVGVWFLLIHKQHFFTQSFARLFVLPFVAVLYWGSGMWQQWQHVASDFWIKQATSAIFIQTLEVYTKGTIAYVGAPLLYTVSLLLIFFAFAYWVKGEKHEHKEAILLIVCCGFLPLVVTYVISALFTPIFHERYIIATLPAFFLLCGYSLYHVYQEGSLRLRHVLVGLVMVYLVLLIQASEQIVNTTSKPALNWGVAQIIQNATPGDILVPKDFLNYLEAKYYAENNNKSVTVYAYTPTGKIPWYIGGILFDNQYILTTIPEDKRAWVLYPDGGYELSQ